MVLQEARSDCLCECEAGGDVQAEKCDDDAKSEHADFKADKITFKGKTQSARGVAAIQQMVMEGGPVETVFTVYSDFA